MTSAKRPPPSRPSRPSSRHAAPQRRRAPDAGAPRRRPAPRAEQRRREKAINVGGGGGRSPRRGDGRPAAGGKRRRSLLWRFRRLLFAAGLLGAAGLVGAGYVVASVPLPPEEIPVETTFLFDAAGNRLAELSTGENRVSVELDEVSPTFIEAVLATEDRDFFSHPGVDATAILRATIADLRGRPLQGGSTITQQYVKNVFVGDERTVVRKLKEATLAVKVEQRYDKDQILQRYLNTVYFGRGAYGVQAAAKSYFGVNASELDVQRSAYLAGLLRAPELADASREPATADRRRDLVLRSLVDVGALTEAQRTEMASVPVASLPGFRDRDAVVQDNIVGKDVGTEFFVEYVRAQLADRFGDARLNGGGLRVYTTLDLDLQRAAYAAVYSDTLNQPEDPAGALVALDADGRVKAMVGGRSYGENKVNYAVGTQGGGGGRQAGSAFKPFVLAEAITEGYSVESALDSPASLTFPGANNGKDYKVSNYESTGHGRVNVIEATRVSSNTVYAQMAEALGPQAVAETAQRLGIGAIDPSRVGLSIALGTPTVSVLDMADAYLTFATRGFQIDPSVVVRVTDADGNVLLDGAPRKERVLEPAQADTINTILRGVVEKGTGKRAGLGIPIAGKTGTTQDNGDAWFVGYTPGMSVAVWMGYPEGQSRQMKAVHGTAVTGGSLPADIFRRFMQVAADRDEYRGSFVKPPPYGGEPLKGSGIIKDGVTTTTTTEPEEVEETTTTTEAPEETTTTTAPEGAKETTTTTGAPEESTTTTAPEETTTTTTQRPALGTPPGG
ncbi:MAG: transglycosylase domain-containing protein [Acidimicrobiales bacterium]